MNPWEAILLLIGWGVLGVVIIVVALVFAGFILWVWQRIHERLPHVKKAKQLQERNLEAYMREATTVGNDIYKDELLMPEAQLRAFKAGARWGWGFHTRG